MQFPLPDRRDFVRLNASLHHKMELCRVHIEPAWWMATCEQQACVVNQPSKSGVHTCRGYQRAAHRPLSAERWRTATLAFVDSCCTCTERKPLVVRGTIKRTRPQVRSTAAALGHAHSLQQD